MHIKEMKVGRERDRLVLVIEKSDLPVDIKKALNVAKRHAARIEGLMLGEHLVYAVKLPRKKVQIFDGRMQLKLELERLNLLPPSKKKIRR